MFKPDEQDGTNKLGNAVYKYMRKIGGEGIKLEFRKLGFHIADQDDKYYECKSCHRVHLNKGTVYCTNTNCRKKFNEDNIIIGDVKDLWEKHFISYDIKKEPREPRRLHTEELTGQTDNIQERLLGFKDLIICQDEEKRLGEKLTKSIDMINVTTTMEVGVDLGSLEAIFQGNMSPKRYNYQQRVGRSGRRGQAFSLAVTCCRGRSHDTYYYYNATDEMLGSIPVPPSLALAPYKENNSNGEVYKMKLAIVKRVIVKSILRDAFDYILDEKTAYNTKDTCGEFDLINKWKNHKNDLINWIKEHNDRINETINLYISQFNRNDIDITADIQAVQSWIVNNMVDYIDHAITNYPNDTVGVAQCLSETGFLPLYGMPSDLRMFYHGYENGNVKSINRDLEMSITEFAPGCKKTKDKGEYRIEGITLPIDEKSLSFNDKINQDALSDRFILNLKDDQETIESIDNVSRLQIDEVRKKLDDQHQLLVIPKAYRSYKIKDNRGKDINNSERYNVFSQSTVFASNNHTDTVKEVNNLSISAYGISLNDISEVWHINTNNNRYFEGVYDNQCYPPKKEIRAEGHQNFMFYEKSGKRIEDKDDSIKIALGARKATEMIKFQLNGYNSNLDLSVKTGNVSAIRAAFYSAAFLIQRALADYLDVQPEEIEISDKMDDNGVPIIYLSDALPNGAGLVSYLYQEDHLKDLLTDIIEFRTNFMKSLISEDHRQECLTACQKCLKTYTNRGFHHVLDWRLGVGIIRLMMNPNYDFGFTESDNNYSELLDEKRILTIAAQKLGLAPENAEQDGHIWRKNDAWGHSRCWMIYHPLWNREQAKQRFCPNDSHIQMYNTFKLLRSDVSRDNTDASGVNNTPTTVATTPVTTTNQATQANQIVGGINLSD
jgi:hypothetical protein